MDASAYHQHGDYFARDHNHETFPELLRHYLTLARSLHYKYNRVEEHLRGFIHFLQTLHITHPQQLTAEIALDYHQHVLDRLRRSTCNENLRAVNRFCQHLVRLQLLDTSPFQNLPAIRETPFIPYIFTGEQLARIFQLKLRTPPHHARHFTHFTHYCAFHTLYGCGLRSSELANLDLEHVDFEQRTLTIRATKFGKERIIPFNDKVRNNLRAYLRLRRTTFPQANTPAFFLSTRGNRYHRTTLYDAFKGALRKLGLDRKDQRLDGVIHRAPTVHSLRHTFAVHRLLRWYRQGADVNEKLPLLATYMGHAHFRYTLVYLRICAETLRQANARFADKFEHLFALWRTQTTPGDLHHEHQ